MFEEQKQATLDLTAQGECVGYKVFDKSGKLLPCGHTACYAGMRASGEGSIIVNRLQKKYYQGSSWKTFGKEGRFMYLDWLLNESPWKDVFITKDAVKALEEELVVSTCDVPGPLLLGGMTAMRGLWEGCNGNLSHKYFANFVENGCTKDFAYLMSHCLYSDRALSFGGGGHCSLSPVSMRVGDVVNFLSHQTKADQTPFWKSNQYLGVHKYWLSMPDRPLFSTWITAGAKRLAGVDKVKAAVNPFDLHPNGGQDSVKVTPATVGILCGKFYEEEINK